MSTLFMVCFGVGAGFTFLSLILGGLLDGLDFGAHFDTDFSFGAGVSPLKPQVIAAFLTVFGGVGMLLQNHIGSLLALMGAGLAGLAIAFVMYRFVIVPLYKHQNTSAVEIQSLIGLNATVSDTIQQGGYGRITYYANGNTYSSPAKAEDGGFIANKEPVEIVYIEKHTFFVRKKNVELHAN